MSDSLASVYEPQSCYECNYEFGLECVDFVLIGSIAEVVEFCYNR